MRIQELITQLKEKGLTNMQVANELKISQSMVCAYKKGYNASLEVARHVYRTREIVLYPFSKEGVSDEK